MTDDGDMGILVVDKEVGPTSHRVVVELRRILGIRRIGHCGTLDPLATGALVVCLGRFTRLAEWLVDSEKAYQCTLRLGAISDTGDSHGQITPVEVTVPPLLKAIKEAFSQFTGTMEQVPPAFSAVKVGGQRSYSLARRGEAVVLCPRQVHIRSLEVANYCYPDLSLHVVCSRGTYVRSLAMDLGQQLRCGAHVTQLRRTRVGALSVDQALTLEELEQAVHSTEGIKPHIVPVQLALPQATQVVLESDALRFFSCGRVVSWPAEVDSSLCAVFGPDHLLYGMARWEDGNLRPVKVLRPYHRLAW